MCLRRCEVEIKGHRKTLAWYQRGFNVDLKVIEGIKFIDKNKSTLEKIENKKGIHYELLAAILAMELPRWTWGDSFAITFKP